MRIIWRQTRRTGITLQQCWSRSRKMRRCSWLRAGGGAFVRAQPTTEPREPTSLAQFRGRCRHTHESRYKRESPTVDAPVRGRCRWRVFTTTRRDAIMRSTGTSHLTCFLSSVTRPDPFRPARHNPSPILCIRQAFPVSTLTDRGPVRLQLIIH